MMKVAFLMQCHKNPKQINLLLKALKHPQVDVFIHVDSKNENIREDIEKNDGVYLLPKKDCVDVQWAQFSQVKATLNLLNAAISRGGYSHYFLISGQDFPIKSIGEIVKFLSERKDENFIDCALIKRFEKRNDIYFPRMVIGRRIWQKILKGILVYSTGGWNQTFSIIKRLKPANVQYYFGSQWWCLNDAMVKWIYNFLENYPEYIKLFKHSLCPDECFFQTLVMNSPFANTTKPYLHYIKWEKGKSSPKTLTTIDYEELKKTEKLIARKFDINVDAEIIERLRKR
ncbi:beta-1,6-N-acetylglucosaminyltransferase [Hominenteromicrobium sp.]|uniref:beta-1,6-N-acetylglucosaminyltransferase n=1 Tax=Hominenteromicrobium sp. TaxID=3073581 RepID=UPI003AB63106